MSARRTRCLRDLSVRMLCENLGLTSRREVSSNVPDSRTPGPEAQSKISSLRMSNARTRGPRGLREEEKRLFDLREYHISHTNDHSNALDVQVNVDRSSTDDLLGHERGWSERTS